MYNSFYCFLLLRLSKKTFFFGFHILPKQWRWPSDSFLLPMWNCTECSFPPQGKSLTFYNRCGWRQRSAAVEKSGLTTRNHEVACLCSPIKRLGRAVFRMISWKGKEHHALETSTHFALSRHQRYFFVDFLATRVNMLLNVASWNDL
jgi:hypothetical protein